MIFKSVFYSNCFDCFTLTIIFVIFFSIYNSNKRYSCSNNLFYFVNSSKRKINPSPVILIWSDRFLFLFLKYHKISSLIWALISRRQQYFNASVFRVNLMINMLFKKAVFIFKHLPTVWRAESGCGIGFRYLAITFN